MHLSCAIGYISLTMEILVIKAKTNYVNLIYCFK